MKGFSYLKNVTTLRLDQDACIGCGMCVEVCPHQVFVLSGEKTHIVELDCCPGDPGGRRCGLRFGDDQEIPARLQIMNFKVDLGLAGC
jgi:Fe-S-cluster-containing hydrogenase component 2